MGSLGKLSKLASSLPETLIIITAGLAGIFMTHFYGSAGESPYTRFAQGKVNDGFHALAMNYTGVNTYDGRDNDPGTMWTRAVGAKTAIMGGIILGVYRFIKDLF